MANNNATEYVSVSALSRGVVCGKSNALKEYNVTSIPEALAEKGTAIKEAVYLWELKDFSEDKLLEVCRESLKVKDYEGSEPYRDLYAMDLCMQLHRMAEYIISNNYTVNRGRSFSVDVNGKQLCGSYSMLLTRPDGAKEVVFIKNKTDFSEKARKEENKPYSCIELNAGIVLPEADLASIWTLVHKDDTSERFMPTYDEAEGKNGKVLTGKQIVSLSRDNTDALSFLNEKISTCMACPNCENCSEKELCKGDFGFRVPFRSGKPKEVSVMPEIKFTAEQEKVIKFRDGKMAVFAGPGSGKTAVLVERYCRMIEEGYSPAHIVLVVFTNKVADEIRERITKRLNLSIEQRKQLNVFTLNALGQKLINDNPSAFGGAYIVASAVMRREILRGILFPEKEDGSKLIALRKRYRNLYGDHNGLASLDSLMQKIEAGNFEPPTNYGEEDIELIMDLYDKFRAKLVSMRAISYDEQIVYPLVWLRENPYNRKLVSSTYRYIMVDEAQDLSAPQYELVRLLAEKGNLVMVGDDDQSIYRFRKGSPEYLLSFEKEEGTEKVVFSENFRAAELLNGSANVLIEGSTELRMQKDYHYQREGVRPEIIVGKTNIVTVVERLLGEGYQPSDIDVLARTNKELLDVEKLLKDTCECNVAKDFIREDNVFLFLRAMLDVAINGNEADGMNMYRLVRVFNENPSYNLRNEVENGVIHDFVDEAAKLLRLHVPEDAIEILIENHPELGILHPHPVISSVREWCEEMNLKAETLLEHLNQMVQMSDDTRVDYGIDPDKIRLFTAHDSKGKEFPVVIVYDADAFKDEDGSSEERRLLYVAMTRAKERLFILHDVMTDYLNEIAPTCEAERSA